jgi:hypothetical protein
MTLSYKTNYRKGDILYHRGLFRSRIFMYSYCTEGYLSAKSGIIISPKLIVINHRGRVIDFHPSSLKVYNPEIHG